MIAARRGAGRDGEGQSGGFERAAGLSEGSLGPIPTALFVSPHLDDAAFSCGGTMALLAERGWNVLLATVFTRSVPRPTGFALQCQLDKGLSPDADYMALRRGEDRLFAARVWAGEVVHLDLPEAPHRGYDSAAALFAGVHQGDDGWRRVADGLAGLLETWTPDLVFVPQALGSHVDHLQVVRAVSAVPDFAGSAIRYRDAPYAARDPSAHPPSLIPEDLGGAAVDISSTLEKKLHACAAYTTQLGFQFGGQTNMRAVLSAFAAAEAERHDGRTTAAEAFLVAPNLSARLTDQIFLM